MTLHPHNHPMYVRHGGISAFQARPQRATLATSCNDELRRSLDCGDAAVLGRLIGRADCKKSDRQTFRHRLEIWRYDYPLGKSIRPPITL